MATETYTPIASITLGSSVSSVTFSSIPQDYRDLVLVCTVTIPTGDNVDVIINSDTGANYSQVVMTGDGSSGTSGSRSSNELRLSNTITSQDTQWIVQFLDYSATDKHKTSLIRGNDNATPKVAAWAGRYADTTAITNLDIQSGTDKLNTGATFALYGIAS